MGNNIIEIKGENFHGPIIMGDQINNHTNNISFGDYIINHENTDIIKVYENLLSIKEELGKNHKILEQIQSILEDKSKNGTSKIEMSKEIRQFLNNFASNFSSSYLVQLLTLYNNM